MAQTKLRDGQLNILEYVQDTVGDMVAGNTESGISVTYDDTGGKLNFVVNISSQIREKLTTTRTYYVRTDGNDANSGLANNSSNAFLTVQRAVNVSINSIDNAGHNITIQIADGTYSEDVVLGDCLGSGTITIQGNSGTPANVVVGSFMKWGGGSSYTIKDLKFTKVSATSAIGLRYGARINFTNVNFGGSYTYHIESIFGANAICDGNYTISGGAAAHISARAFGGITIQSKTITLTGTPAFSTAFAECRYTGVMFANGNTFSGSATGSRYLVDLNGVIQTVGGGANYFPGNAAGSAATGGQYA